MSQQEPQDESSNVLAVIQGLIDNDLIDQAMSVVKKHGLKVEIQNGKLVDISNTTEAWLRRFITATPAMMVLKDKVRKLAKINDEVLIIGPTGTGKELIARALHGEREGRFIAVNCAGIPENLMESILFGHVKGSFTGAIETKKGYMTLAENGTLFLDEIGELPLELQAKLLRAIQEKVINKVGGEKDETINCRIVCATNKELQSLGDFRIDLLARISVFELRTTSLQARPEDIIPILESLPDGKEYINALTKTGKKSMDTTFNVRSLQSAVRRFKILGEL